MEERWRRSEPPQFSLKKKEEVYAALPYAASFHCLVDEWQEWHDYEGLKPKPKDKCIFVDKKVEVVSHCTEWCAAASKHR